MSNVDNPGAMVATPEDATPAQPAPPRRPWFRRYWWIVALVAFAVIVAAVIVTSLVVKVPYVIESPGYVQPTEKLVMVTGHQTYPTNDKIYLVTVNFDSDVSLLEKFAADHDGDKEILPASDALQGLTPQQNTALNKVFMRQSKDDATLLALQRLGYNVNPTTTGALILDVAADAPAKTAVGIGDTIVGVDGVTVTNSDDLSNVLGQHRPGEQVTLAVENADNLGRTAEVVLGNNPKKPGVGYLGVSLDNRLVYHLPNFDVSIDSQEIGGPSAGLAFTLSILDALSPGDLTGGQSIAATGEIHLDGTVGEIGGVAQKVTTVARAGVKTFFVPMENADEAKAHAPKDLTIVPVHTLDDALNYLAAHGGAPVSAAPTQ